MSRTPSHITSRRTATFVVLAVSLGATVLGLSQCRLVEDRLTGVRISTARTQGTSCLANCQKAAQEARRAEHELHASRTKACDHDRQCLEAERERHKEALRDIAEQRETCINGCHSQGRGHGGD